MRVHGIVGYRRRSLTKPYAGTAPRRTCWGRLFDPERPALWAGRTLARIH
jgi:hypothetical protein